MEDVFIAVLLHSFNENSRREFGDAWQLSEMREKAEKAVVSFSPKLYKFRFHIHNGELEILKLGCPDIVKIIPVI